MSSVFTPKIQTFKAEADLSSDKYRFVKFGSNPREVVKSGANNNAIGILQNDPELGAFAEVAKIGGGSFAIAGGTITQGDLLESDANGAAILAAGAGNHQVRARAMESAVAGDVFEVELIAMSHDI